MNIPTIKEIKKALGSAGYCFRGQKLTDFRVSKTNDADVFLLRVATSDKLFGGAGAIVAYLYDAAANELETA